MGTRRADRSSVRPNSATTRTAPIKKSDGSWTYFAADTAYHHEKAEDSPNLVNIWGADHAGTVKRVQAAVRALTDGRSIST